MLFVYLHRNSNTEKAGLPEIIKTVTRLKKTSYVKSKKKNWPCLQGHGMNYHKALINNCLTS
jgi:hypothetical protein